MYIFSFVGIIFMDIIFSGRIKNLPEGKQLFEAADFPSEGFSDSIIAYRKLFSQLTRESCQILSATVFLIWSVTGPLLAIFPRIAV